MSNLTTALNIGDEKEVIDYNPITGEIIDENSNNNPIDEMIELTQEDHKLARQTMLDVLKDATEVLASVKNVAMASENSEQYNAFSRISDTVMKAAEKLLSTDKDLISVLPAVEEPQIEANQTNITNNILFTGTTAELLSFLKDKRQKEINDGI